MDSFFLLWLVSENNHVAQLSWHLLFESQKWEYQKNVGNMFGDNQNNVGNIFNITNKDVIDVIDVVPVSLLLTLNILYTFF